MENTKSQLISDSTGGDWRIRVRVAKVVISHIVLFTIALFLSFVVYDSMKLSEEWFPSLFFHWLLVTLAVKLVVFGMFKQYHGWWRYASVSDLLSIIMAAHLSAAIIVFGWYIAKYFAEEQMSVLAQVPVSVMLMDWVATIVMICGARLAIRLYYEETRALATGRLTRVLIVGAGNAGETLLREIQRTQVMRYEVIGFVDDDHTKLGARIHGIPVLGNTTQIKEIAQKRKVDEIVIAMPSATHKQLRRVIGFCQGANLRFSTIPDLVAIASGEVSVSQMREVDINDLLGRNPVNLDVDLIREFIRGKVLMVTGAGGSIGAEMCRQIGTFKPKSIVLIEQAENSLFHIERELPMPASATLQTTKGWTGFLPSIGLMFLFTPPLTSMCR